MSAKHRVFPPEKNTDTTPDSSGFGEFGGPEIAGPHGYNGFPTPPPSGQPQPEQAAPKKAAKGHAAYAASDKPGPSIRSQGFGPIGGLYTDDVGGPTGHGVQAHAESEQLLSAVPLEVLEAECRARVCPQCPVKKEADAERLRALADLDNARKRLQREKEEQTRYAAEAVLADILPSLDNFDLALQHAGDHEACKNFVIGVSMTRKLLLEALSKHGLTLVGDVGEEFNPAVHEAVGMVDDKNVPDNHVCALLSNGYKLNDRLLRPAKVMVCKHQS